MKTKLGRLRARLFSPLSWRTRTRRIFLMTFPLSLPAWVAFTCLVVVARWLEILAQPIVYFWNAPPRRLHRGYYKYYKVRHKQPEETARIIRLSDREAA
jgi:hypothetical protein